MEKRCSNCKIIKDFGQFQKDRSHKDGLRSNCKACCKSKPIIPEGLSWCCKCAEFLEISNFYKAKKNKSGLSSSCKKHTIYNSDRASYHKKYYLDHKDKFKNDFKVYYLAHSDASKLRAKKWKKQNQKKLNALEAKRRADKLKAVPKWVDKKHLDLIRDFYQNCPEGMEVDHIVPLRAANPVTHERIASGLHVLWNLQYLSEKENSSKQNKLYPEISGVNSDSDFLSLKKVG